MEKLDTPHISPRNKLGIWVAYLSLGLIAAISILFLYWSFQPQDVLEIHNEPFPVRTIREHPNSDGVVILKVDYCKKTEAVGRVRTSFVSESRETFLPVAEDKGPKGCNVVELPILIPTDLTPGDYKVKFRVEYKINPIRTVVEEFESSQFTVYPKE